MKKLPIRSVSINKISTHKYAVNYTQGGYTYTLTFSSNNRARSWVRRNTQQVGKYMSA